MNRSFNCPGKLTISLVLAAFAILGTGATSASSHSEASIFDVKGDKNFSHYREPLMGYLRSRGARKPTNVCILGEQHTDGTKSAWVIWRAGNTMLLWDGGESSMIASRRVLDLTRDVVASDGDLHGSTYLVTNGWVESQADRCQRLGTNVRLTASTISPHQRPLQKSK